MACVPFELELPDVETDMDKSRVISALLIALVGLVVPSVLAGFLAWKGWAPSDVSTLVGLFISVVGTLVGAFLGVQAGSAGKDKAEDIARRALAALPPESAARALQS
jgi:high-affinity K+ transport system ATPase subunit B